MKIALLGDIGLLGAYSLSTNPELINKLNEISEFLATFDLVVGNLETPFSYKKNTWGAKSAYICTDPINVEVLKALHVDAVTIANNHMYDFGREGFETTINILAENGIAWFGANGKDFRIEFDDNKLVFNGFCCYSTNPLKIASRYGRYGINRFNVGEVQEIIRRNHNEGYLNIIAVHSGIEHVNRPSINQIKVSHLLAEEAAYLWYGHHPHVVQGIENYKSSIIAHSLGNFCFAGNVEDKNRPIIELSENNRQGMILELEIDGNKIMNCNPVLIYVGKDGYIKIIDNGVINEFSDFIKTALSDTENYEHARIMQREVYLKRRKKLRTLTWFLKRLRLRYVRLLLSNHNNARRYKTNVSSFLSSQS